MINDSFKACRVRLFAFILITTAYTQLFKGDRYLELLAKADTVLIDKIGMLTTGELLLTDVIHLNRLREERPLTLPDSAERFSEHPLAKAVRQAVRVQHLCLMGPPDFMTEPDRDVRANFCETQVKVGSW